MRTDKYPLDLVTWRPLETYVRSILWKCTGGQKLIVVDLEVEAGR